MKKIVIVTLTLLAPLCVKGQNKSPQSFGDGWFLQANLAGSAFYGNQEQAYDFSKSPFEAFRSRLALSLSVGKWFSPEIALRTKANGIWGRSVISEDSETNASTYFTLSEQVLLDLTNIIEGREKDCKWHVIPYIGGGLGRSMTYNHWGINLSCGILNTYKITNCLHANLEIGYVLHTQDFDGIIDYGVEYHSLMNEDQQILLELGVIYSLGK